MPLVIQFRGPYASPTIVCDHCGKTIDKAQEGNYQWSHATGVDKGQTAPMYFTHKACCHDFEQAHGVRRWEWGAIGLEALPAFLATNLHIPWSQATAKARQMSRL
jgi:hypothetical protein